MRIPSDQIHGSPSYHSSLTRRDDGTYEAINTSMPAVPAQRGVDQNDALAKLRQATEKWIGDGCPAK